MCVYVRVCVGVCVCVCVCVCVSAACDAGTQFRCNSGECMSLCKRCDGQRDCWDSSDEFNCSTLYTHSRVHTHVFITHSCGNAAVL